MPTVYDEMRHMRERYPDWIWNRSDAHILLRQLGSPDASRVPVEPGNSFSPGMGSFAVSSWLYDHEGHKLWAPELMASQDLTWSFLYGHIPVLLASWMADGILVESRLFVSGDKMGGGGGVFMRLRLMNARSGPTRIDLLTVVRSFGAGGGPVHSLGFTTDDEGCSTLMVNGQPGIVCETHPTRFSAVSWSEDGLDISARAQTGDLPSIASVNDPSGWASGACIYELSLESGETACFDFVAPVCGCGATPPHRAVSAVSYEDREAEHVAAWQDIFDEVKLQVPDARFANAFYSQVAHICMCRDGDAERAWSVLSAPSLPHHLLHLGEPERTWEGLDYLLGHHLAQGLYLWSSDASHTEPCSLTSTEMLLFLRDTLVLELEDADVLNTIIIGAGVPASWVRGYPCIGVRDMPVRRGRVSWFLEGRTLTIDCAHPPEAGYVVMLPLAGDIVAASAGVICLPQGGGSTLVRAEGSEARGLPAHIELEVRLWADTR